MVAEPFIESLLEEIDVATERGEFRRARSLLEQAFRHGPDETQQALLTVRAAFVPETDVGVDDLSAAVAQLREANWLSEVARAQGALGALHMTHGNPMEAACAYLDAESSSAQLGDASSARRSALNRAAALISAVQPREALQVLAALWRQLCADRTETAGERALLGALTASNAAAARLLLGDDARAKRDLGVAARLYTSLGQPARAATVFLNQAYAANRADRPESALDMYQQAADLFERAGDQSAAMRSLLGAAATAALLGRVEESEARYATVLRYAQTHGDRQVRLRAVIGWSAVRAASDPTTAVKLLTDSVSADDLQDPCLAVEAGDWWHNRGMLAAQLGDSDIALSAFVEAERIFSGVGLPAPVARARIGRAIALDDAGRCGEAAQLARQILETADESGIHGMAKAHLLTNLAAFGLRAARQAGATPERDVVVPPALAAVAEVECFRYSLRSAGHRENVMVGQERTTYATAIDAALACGDGDLVAALVEITRTHAVPAPEIGVDGGLGLLGTGAAFPLAAPRAITARSASTAAGDQRQGVVVLRDLATAIGGHEVWWVNTWIDRNRAVVAALGPHRTLTSDTEVDIEAYLALSACLGTVFPVDAQIAGLGRGDPRDVASYRTAVGVLLGDEVLREQWAKRLSAVQRQALVEHPIVTLARQEGEAGLLWRISRFLLPERLRCYLLDSLGRTDRPLLAVAPATGAGRVPWALLPLRRPGDGEGPATPRVADAADVVHVAPAAFMAAKAPVPPTNAGRGDVLVVADPLDDLPAARGHTVVADRILAGPWLNDPDRLATPARVLQALRGQRPGFLILAAHIDEPADENPSDAGILLAGPGGDEAVLTARHLVGARITAPPTSMLLGCESLGASTGAEWTSIALALLGAGGTRVVGTLWPTLDDPTAAKVEGQLVRHMIADPAHGHARFLQDQLSAWRQQSGAGTHPYHWAGFAEVRGGSLG